MNNATKIVVGIVVLVPLLYVGSCNVIEQQRETGIAQVKMGDTEAHVLAAMGQPTDRETASTRQVKYGAPECKNRCAQRLWYPNPISPAGEAWSVDLDGTGHVTATDHIVSP